MVGTTERRQTLDQPIKTSDEEIDYLLAAYNHHFKHDKTRDDIVHQFAGVRPLIRSSADSNKISALKGSDPFLCQVSNGEITIMQIGSGGLITLAKMICGDEPFGFFPYRNSSYLTQFFVGLDLDYAHDGSTRRHWVNDTLKEINNQPSSVQSMPSSGMVTVIESLLHPEHFLFNKNKNVDHKKALEEAVKLFKTYDLTVTQKTNGQVTLSPAHGEFVSTSHQAPPVEKLIECKPSVFNVPSKPRNEKLISVMMPFNAAFAGTYEAVKRVADHMGLECLRADDIWDNSTFMQDIFDLIFCAKVIVVDFTGRNPNVMYETGIAHTLGRTVIPITQSLDDIPSDVGHIRALKYLPNEQGYKDLSKELRERLKTITDAD